MKSNLSPVRVTRKDGVNTTVWKKDAKVGGSRLSGLKSTPSSASSITVMHPADHAISWVPGSPVEEPRWWKKLAANSAKHGSVAELLDVFPSPHGDIVVSWETHAVDDIDTGLSVDSGIDIEGVYFHNAKTGERVGSLKLGSMSDWAFDKSFGDDEYTPFRYDNRYGGGNYVGLNKWEKNDPSLDEQALRRGVWRAAKMQFRESYTRPDGEVVSYYNIGKNDYPDDATVSEDLARFAARIRPKMDDARAGHNPERPRIDYSEIELGMQGAGLGAALYIYTAKKLGTQGKVLAASGIQSDKADSLWNKLMEKLPNNSGTLTENFREETTYKMLDFRTNR